MLWQKNYPRQEGNVIPSQGGMSCLTCFLLEERSEEETSSPVKEPMMASVSVGHELIN
jgi:hypothetical protein